MTQNDKKLCESHPISQEPYIIYMIVIYITQVYNDNISMRFFRFFTFFIFQVVRRVRGKKLAQND